MSSPSRFFSLFFGDWIFLMATILQLKVAKRRLFEKVSLERWIGQYRVFKQGVNETGSAKKNLCEGNKTGMECEK